MNSTKNDKASPSKPKRPLTPYNIFYRFKRAKIIQAISTSNGSLGKAAVLKLVRAIPGLEDMSSSELKLLHPKEKYARSRDIVRREMRDRLLPFEGKRSHRKTHPGMIEFLEMSRMMCDQWKLVDGLTKTIFKELAEEGKRQHRQRNSKDETDTSSSSPDLEQDDAFDKLLQDLDVNEEDSRDTEDSDVLTANTMPLLTIKAQDDTASNQCFPSSSKSIKPDKVNIVTPITSRPKVQISFDAFEEKIPLDSSGDEEDDFCKYIDSHIHLVDDADQDDIFDHDESVPNTLVDLINMDESIEHCRLAAV
ncbi:hypothetical protein ACHAXN_002997 [Cyclotella atomus]